MDYRSRRELDIAVSSLTERSVNGLLVELLRALTEPAPPTANARPW